MGKLHVIKCTRDFLETMPVTRFFMKTSEHGLDCLDGDESKKGKYNNPGSIEPLQIPTTILQQGRERTFAWLEEKRNILVNQHYNDAAARENRDFKLAQIDDSIQQLRKLS